VRGPQGCRPALAQIVEIRLAGLDAVENLKSERVPPCNRQINGQPDPEIRAHSRVHGDQADLQGLVEIRVLANRPIENGLAVFVLADLEVGSIRCVFQAMVITISSAS
jgi:hypothetical protein